MRLPSWFGWQTQIEGYKPNSLDFVQLECRCFYALALSRTRVNVKKPIEIPLRR